MSKRVLRGLVPVICPPEAAGLADAIADHVALQIEASGAILQRAFDAGLAAYDLGALLRHGKRSHKLTGDAAERYYQSWEHGFTPAHVQFARALNQLISMSCFEQPAMMELCGYRPAPWIEEVSKKRLSVFADDIQKQDAQILAPDPLRPHARRKKEVA